MEFPDYKHTQLEKKETSLVNGRSGRNFTPELYSKMFYKKPTYTGSDGRNYITAAAYFNLESGKSFDLIGSKEDIYGWYTAKNNISHYGENLPKVGDRINASKLVPEAIEHLLDKTIDFSKYDLNSDGIIDSIFIIHAGKGEQWDNFLGHDAIWSFSNKFSDINNEKPYLFKDHNNKIWKIDKFSIIEQDVPLDLFLHEIGHSLGLHDLYTHDSPVAYWSIMGDIYCGKITGTLPNSFGAYPRFFLQNKFQNQGFISNWANIKEFYLNDLIKNPQEIFLFPSGDKKRVNLIKINLDHSSKTKSKNISSERYFLLEWRNNEKDGIDSGLNYNLEKIPYQGGLIIWYIDESTVDKDGKFSQELFRGKRFATVIDSDPSPVFKVENNTFSIHNSNKYNMYDAAFSLRNTPPILFPQNKTGFYHNNLVYSPYFYSLGSISPQYKKYKSTILPKEDIKILITEDHVSFGKIAFYSGNINKIYDKLEVFIGKNYFLIKSPSTYELDAVVARVNSKNEISERKNIDLEKIHSGLFKGTFVDSSGSWHLEYIREFRPNEYRCIYNSKFTNGWGFVEKNINTK